MSDTDGLALAARLPDLPRWVEVRDLLLHGGGELELFDTDGYGGDDVDEPSFTLQDGHALFVVGLPPADALARITASTDIDEVVAAMPARAVLDDILRDWTYDTIIVHELRDEVRLVRPGDQVRFLDPATISGLAIDGELRDELEAAAPHSRIAASFVGDDPVAFCYAGATTETLWDVSIDTLVEHRRKGHAARCAAFMVHQMRELGKEPVWQSAEANPASWRLAARQGFVAVDRLAFWTRPPAGR